MESGVAKAGVAIAIALGAPTAISNLVRFIRAAGDIDFVVSRWDMLVDILQYTWLPIAGVVIGFVLISIALMRKKAEPDQGFPSMLSAAYRDTLVVQHHSIEG